MNSILLNMIILFTSLNSFAMIFESERIEKIIYKKETDLYEVVIVNKAAFYIADKKLLSCLQKGMKENVKLEIDPMKIMIKTCQ